MKLIRLLRLLLCLLRKKVREWARRPKLFRVCTPAVVALLIFKPCNALALRKSDLQLEDVKDIPQHFYSEKKKLRMLPMILSEDLREIHMANEGLLNALSYRRAPRPELSDQERIDRAFEALFFETSSFAEAIQTHSFSLKYIGNLDFKRIYGTVFAGERTPSLKYQVNLFPLLHKPSKTSKGEGFIFLSDYLEVLKRVFLRKNGKVPLKQSLLLSLLQKREEEKEKNWVVLKNLEKAFERIFISTRKVQRHRNDLISSLQKREEEKEKDWVVLKNLEKAFERIFNGKRKVREHRNALISLLQKEEVEEKGWIVLADFEEAFSRVFIGKAKARQERGSLAYTLQKMQKEEIKRRPLEEIEKTFSRIFPRKRGAFLFLSPGSPQASDGLPGIIEVLHEHDDELITTELTPKHKNVNNDLAQASTDAEREKLFLQVFGKKKKAQKKQTVLNFYIGKKNVGLFPATVSGGGKKASFEASSLLGELKKRVRPNVAEEVEKQIDPNGKLNLEKLRKVGLIAKMDQLKMLVVLEIPPEMIKAKVHIIAGSSETADKKYTLPTYPTGFLNVHVDKEFHQSPTEGTDDGQIPMSMGLSGSANYHNWVLEAFGTYTENQKPGIIRDDLRIIRHEPGDMLVFTLGDLNIPTLGFQSGRNMAGIEATKEFSLQPDKLTYPISSQRLFLKNPATVEIWVNGIEEHTIRLQAGEHDLRRLPVEVGFNDVEVRIIDDFGREEVITFPFINEPELLEEGIDSFSYSMGFPETGPVEKRRYDMDMGTASFFHRKGWTENFTGGAYLQTDPKQIILGFEGLRAIAAGVLFFDISRSRIYQGSSGLAGEIGFRNYQDNYGNADAQWSWQVQGTYNSERFATLGTLDPLNTVMWDLGGNLNGPLINGINAQLGGSYQVVRDSDIDSYLLNFGLDKRWRSGVNLRFNLSAKRSILGVHDLTARVSFTWTLPLPQQVLRVNYSNRDDTTDVTWSRNSPTKRGWSGSAAYKQNKTGELLNLRGTVVGYRGSVKASYAENNTRDDGKKTTRKSRLVMDSAIVYADGNFAISQPVTDSFVMVIPKDSAKGMTVGINPSGDDYRAVVDWLGPGVLHNLQAYRPTRVLLDARDLEIGKDIGKSMFNVLPTFKSGTVIYVGSEPTIFLQGQLLDMQGQALGLQVGRVFSLDHPDIEPQMFFTNRSGKFGVPKLKAGRFKFTLMAYPSTEMIITIPSQDEPRYMLGKVAYPVNEEE